jgi:sugar lactone lactonase YvrE
MSYIAVNPKDGRVFITDRTQGVIYIFDPDGKYLDSILTPALTLKGFVAQQNNGDVPDGTHFFYSFLAHKALYTLPGGSDKLVDLDTGNVWAPIGVRFDGSGNLLVTDAYEDVHRVYKFDANLINSSDYWKKWISSMTFGVRGSDKGQLLYPNDAVSDSRGRIYVSDGNNSRISMWSGDGQFLNQFGAGGGASGLNLPRGIWMDEKDHLHVADPIAQMVKVFDVSGDTPAYLYSFGDFGVSDGLFNFPNDIVMDKSGWLFVADRENSRIQVWSY